MIMIKIIQENKFDVILLAASILAATGITAAFFITGGDILRLFVVMIAAWVWLYYQLRTFIRILRRYGVKNPVTSQINRALGLLVGKIVELLGKIFAPVVRRFQNFQLPTWRRANRLTYFQDEKIRIISGSKKRNPFRKMKWRALQNHRERVRFIYISFLQQKIRKGATVLPSHTPNELHVKLNINDDPTTRLFSLYNMARYAGDDAIVQKEDVEEILPCAPRRLRL